MKKEIIRICLFFLVFLFLIENSFCLGVSPAKIVLNFEPGLKEKFPYKVTGISETKSIKVSAHGYLSEYVKISKPSFKGPNVFDVYLNLPQKIEKPGKHRIWIKVEEDTHTDEELAASMIGTSVTINVAIDIFVPYPGRYLEVTEFSTKSINQGEDVNFKIDLINRGEEAITFSPEIIIRDIHNNLIDKLYLSERTLHPTQSISLKKDFKTEEVNPGSYNATLIIDYGGESPAREETSFRIGTLIIYLIEYPRKIEIEGLKKFDLEIESGWNDHIYGAYADVILSNSSGNAYEFKTSTTPLVPWERKNITGYIETNKISPGEYNAEITFIYYGRDVGKSNVENVKVTFVIKKDYTLIIIALATSIVLLIIIITVIILSRYIKNVKKR